jgi:prepilin-type N-terminal cleavage/methylation domain-containing protein
LKILPIKNIKKSSLTWRLRKARQSKAFTLVEVTIATAIFAMTAGAIINSMLLAKYSTQLARSRAVAYNLISSRSEEVTTWSELVLRDMVNSGSNVIVETSAPNIILNNAFRNGFVSRTTTITTNQNMFLVRIQVQWTQPAMGSTRTMSESASTIVYPSE